METSTIILLIIVWIITILLGYLYGRYHSWDQITDILHQYANEKISKTKMMYLNNEHTIDYLIGFMTSTNDILEELYNKIDSIFFPHFLK